MKLTSPTELQREILFQTDSFEIVSILWSKNSLSPLHNHGWSQCHVLIQEGLFENRLVAGAKTEIRRFEAGQVISSPIASSHELRCLTETGKTLHVYTPKIKEHKTEDRKFSASISMDLLAALDLGKGIPFDDVEKILNLIQDHSISTRSPFFMNQLFSGIHPQALLAEKIIAQTKTTMATHEASPVFARIESEVVSQLCKLIGWSEKKSEGVAVPGGSSANFMALQLAKQRKFPEAKKQGLGGKTFKIFISEQAHYSFQKAAVAMGFGTESIVTVDTHQNGKMKADSLKKNILQSQQDGHIPLLVCATAGTTVHGAFDPITEIYQVCQEQNIWLHVDGAWGGPALFSKKIRNLVDGIELADSVTFDAHKLLGASLTCSFILTKHSGLLLEANDVTGADYLFHDGQEPDRGKMSWQCGRRADALSFWSIWKNLGTDGLGDLVNKLLDVRDQSLIWIREQNRLEVVKEPSFLNLCIRVQPPNGVKDNNWSQKVREELKNRNLAMVNFSTDEKGPFLRLILAHPEMTCQHVIEILTFALEAPCN